MDKKAATWEKLRSATASRMAQYPATRELSAERTVKAVRRIAGTRTGEIPLETKKTLWEKIRLPPFHLGTKALAERTEARRVIRFAQSSFPKEKKAMDPMTETFFTGLLDGLTKKAEGDDNPGPSKKEPDEVVTQLDASGKTRAMVRLEAAKGTSPAMAVKKTAAPVAEAAPAAKSLAEKLVRVIQKRPVLTAATAAAAGAGAATGMAQAKAKKEEQDRRREQIRQLLMQRLSESGYGA